MYFLLIPRFLVVLNHLFLSIVNPLHRLSYWLPCYIAIELFHFSNSTYNLEIFLFPRNNCLIHVAPAARCMMCPPPSQCQPLGSTSLLHLITCFFLVAIFGNFKALAVLHPPIATSPLACPLLDTTLSNTTNS
jgi:hypothetical protein